MAVETATKVAKTICNLCVTRCGLDVSVENDRIVKVEGMPEHPFRQPCVKAQARADYRAHEEGEREMATGVLG